MDNNKLFLFNKEILTLKNLIESFLSNFISQIPELNYEKTKC